MSTIFSTARRRRTLLACVAISALSTAGATTASAADSPADPGPTIEEFGAFQAPTLPANPSSGFVMGEGSDAIRVYLPSEAAGPAVASNPGQVVYDGATADVRVQADPDGLAIATISPATSTNEQHFSYRFDLPDDAVLEREADGSVSIQNDDGDVQATVLTPWAVDSSGRALPTSYRVSGNVLTQTIDTTGAIGDVTADPHLVPHGPSVKLFPPSVKGPYVTVWFTRRETEAVYKNLRDPVTTVSGAAALACGFIPNPLLKGACAGFNLAVLRDFLTNINQAHDRKHCLTLDVKPLGFNPLNPLSVLDLIKGKNPVLDWNDQSGKECRP
jgi:hypothetical protein